MNLDPIDCFPINSENRMDNPYRGEKLKSNKNKKKEPTWWYGEAHE